jgi:hypothetical protein
MSSVSVEIVGTVTAGVVGLDEKGVLIWDAVGMISKVPESLDEDLVWSVDDVVLLSVTVAVVVVVVGLYLGIYRPSESRACVLFVNCASVSV